jgi:hypothetical protein
VATPAFLLFLPVGLAILVSAFALLGAVLIDAQPAFQLLGAALLFGRFVPFALLLAQGLKFVLQGIVARPGLIVRVTHGGSSLTERSSGSRYRLTDVDGPVCARPTCLTRAPASSYVQYRSENGGKEQLWDRHRPLTVSNTVPPGCLIGSSGRFA